jgi:hypothetical protein
MSSSEPGPETKTYTAHCHCRAITLTLADVPAIEAAPAITCNCSICTDRGALLSFLPKRAFRFSVDGDDDAVGEEGVAKLGERLSEYKFGRGKIGWRFCRACGSTIIGISVGDTWGVNVSFAFFFFFSLPLLMREAGGGETNVMVDPLH